MLLLIVLQIMLFSCKKNDDVVENKKPGFFILTELKSFDAGNMLKSAQSDYNLGDIKASMDYSFILTNGGNQSIFDIVLRTDNESFTITPNEISRLEGNTQFDSISSSGFIPIISLGVVHGTQLNGVGYTDLLPKGVNASVLTISGKTINGSDTISISSNYNFTINAKVMDVKLYVEEVEMDLTTNYGGVSTTLGGLGFMRNYNINSSNVEIENIGNVDIDLTYGNSNVLLEPNTRERINVPAEMIFRLNGNGTITDNNRIQLGNDGIGYFSISNF